jgi:hypothetical protein
MGMLMKSLRIEREVICLLEKMEMLGELDNEVSVAVAKHLWCKQIDLFYQGILRQEQGKY